MNYKRIFFSFQPCTDLHCIFKSTTGDGLGLGLGLALWADLDIIYSVPTSRLVTRVFMRG